MKTLIITLLLSASALLSFAQSTQPVEVFLIGTSHSYYTQYEKFDPVISTVVAYKPDLIFSESLSPADYDVLTDYWNQKGIDKIMNTLKKAGYPAPKNLDAFIKKQYALLAKHPNFHQDRMKLAHALFYKHDFGNANYQLYLINKAKPVLGPEELAACTKILGPVDSLKTLGLRANSEYTTIFYPAAQQLGIQKMTPMDCQTYNTPWDKAWDKSDSLFRRFEKGLTALDTNSATIAGYKKMMSRYMELDKKETEIGKQGRLTEYLNTPEGDEFLHLANFYGGKYMLSVPGYPAKEVSEMLHFWQLRNEGMCRNIVTRAREAGAKRVVVAVGANHRRIMLDILAGMPNVTVKSLNNQ